MLRRLSTVRAICGQRFVLILTFAVVTGRQSPNIFQSRKGGLQPVASARSFVTDLQNSSTGTQASHKAAVLRVAVSEFTMLSKNEASAIEASNKHDRFCEEFCYYMFPMDDEEPTQLLREPCKGGCLRMYSQGAMGFCGCDPLEPPQDPKGGSVRQGSRSGCHSFPDPGQGWNWHASCLDLYDKNHNVIVDQPGYRTPAEVSEKLTNACKIGWQCGVVMSQCIESENLPPHYPRELIEEICGKQSSSKVLLPNYHKNVAHLKT